MYLSLKQAFIESVPCPTLSELRNFNLLHDYAMQVGVMGCGVMSGCGVVW